MKLYNERTNSKRAYSDALQKLELISEEIHRSREEGRNTRTSGEGAEQEKLLQNEKGKDKEGEVKEEESGGENITLA
jgi:hypothetical protein